MTAAGRQLMSDVRLQIKNQEMSKCYYMLVFLLFWHQAANKSGARVTRGAGFCSAIHKS